MKISDIKIERIKNNELIGQLPELYQLKEVVKNNDWHNLESVFDHTLIVWKYLHKIIKNSPSKIKKYLTQKLDNYSRKDLLFLATLFHDIGKKETLRKQNDLTSCINHEEIGAIKIKEVLKRFDLSDKEKDLVIQIVKNHGLMHSILNPENDKLKEEYNKFQAHYSEIFLELILLAKADTLGSYLKHSNPKEFKFRISFYNNILKNY